MQVEEEYETNEKLALSIGKCYSRMFNFITAENYLKEKCSLYANNLPLKLELAHLLIRLQKYQEVGEMFMNFNQEIPENLKQEEQSLKYKLGDLVEINDIMFQANYAKFKQTQKEKDILNAIDNLKRVIQHQKHIIEICKQQGMDCTMEKKRLAS